MPEFATLIRHAIASLRAPRQEARWVMAFEMPRAARWEALLLIVVISVILAQISTILAPLEGDVMFSAMLINPILTTIIQMSLLVIMVFGIFWVGRAMGGQGGFGNAILLVAWMQFVLAGLQIVQTAAMVVMPALASLIGAAGLILFFWLLTNFIAELHGFKSLTKVFVAIMLSMFGFAFGLSIILLIIGVSVPGAPV